MDRDAIERRDFPTARRGYDPAAVGAHLRRLADEIERLGHAAETRPPGLAAGTSEQVRAILEAAETGAGELRAQAGEEARGHVERVERAAAEMTARLARLQEELDRLLEGLRASAAIVSEGLLDLRARVQEMGAEVLPPAAAPAEAAGPGLAPSGVAGSDVAGSGVAGSGVAGSEVAAPEEPAAVASEERARSADEEGARLAALDLALSGRARDDAERYLAEHFELADPAALLDDVYARVGR
jgi:DivIVA domain-containing protein